MMETAWLVHNGHRDRDQVTPKQRVSDRKLLAGYARPQQDPSHLYFELRFSGQAAAPLLAAR